MVLCKLFFCFVVVANLFDPIERNIADMLRGQFPSMHPHPVSKRFPFQPIHTNSIGFPFPSCFDVHDYISWEWARRGFECLKLYWHWGPVTEEKFLMAWLQQHDFHIRENVCMVHSVLSANCSEQIPWAVHRLRCQFILILTSFEGIMSPLCTSIPEILFLNEIKYIWY